MLVKRRKMNRLITDIILTAWYPPTPTEENFRQYKECGFDRIFLLGEYVDGAGTPKMEKALEMCDKFGIKAFVDISGRLEIMEECIDEYAKHPSFEGFNYDEPVIYRNTLTKMDGIVDIAPVVEKMHKKYPTVEFLINLNPTTSLKLPWGTPPFTYEEYLEAQEKYINGIFDGSETTNWLSCDDYPICYDPETDRHFLKDTWLRNVEYIAQAKKNSRYILKTNFFIQVMPYGVPANLHDRVPTYEDISLQAYTLLAFGFDSIAYFCYATPTAAEFSEHQYSMIDRSEQKTQTYFCGQKLNGILRKLNPIYKRLKNNWRGVYPVYGDNAAERNVSFGLLKKPLAASDIDEMVSARSDEDILIGCFKDEDGKAGYIVVNAGDTFSAKNAKFSIRFKETDLVSVYRNGEEEIVRLTDNEFNGDLDVGEGILILAR